MYGGNYYGDTPYGAPLATGSVQSATQPATARISQIYTKGQVGVSRISAISVKTQPATANIIVLVVKTKTQTAVANISVPHTVTKTQRATAAIASTHSRDLIMLTDGRMALRLSNDLYKPL